MVNIIPNPTNVPTVPLGADPMIIGKGPNNIKPNAPPLVADEVGVEDGATVTAGNNAAINTIMKPINVNIIPNVTSFISI